MRISTVEGDPGYAAFLATGYVKVFLDGEELKWCVTADEEEGVVVVHPVDELGQPKIHPNGEEFLIEERRGKVEIRPMGALAG